MLVPSNSIKYQRLENVYCVMTHVLKVLEARCIGEIGVVMYCMTT